jgi:MinD superfamily P-loop ATPase
MKIIGITGGKGGTGKSTIATAIACELSKKGKVLLVDGDVDCPNDHLLLDIERIILKKIYQRIPKWDFEKCTQCGLCGMICKTKATVSIRNKFPIFAKEQCNGCGACILKCPSGAISWSEKEIGTIYDGSNYNVDLLSGELKSSEPFSEFIVNSLNEIVEKRKNNYEYIIVDTSAGIHCPVIAALELCDQVFAVTEPTPLGAHDLRLILQLLKELKINTKIIINRSDIGDKKEIELLSREFNAQIVAGVPYSKDIISKYLSGKPIQEENITKIIEKHV